MEKDVISDEAKNKKYYLQKIIGQGSYGICFRVVESLSGKFFACKKTVKAMSINESMALTNEIKIHSELHHRHVVQYVSHFEDSIHNFIILELCARDTLDQVLHIRKVLTDPEARYFLRQTIRGVKYLHSLSVVHRDLKLSNLFLTKDLIVKIGDFGLSTVLNANGDRRLTICGTPNYVAPEVLDKSGHGTEVDIWALGCILYILLHGTTPFAAYTQKETFNNIRFCQYVLSPNLNSFAVFLLRRIFCPSPYSRPNITEMEKDDYFQRCFTPRSLPSEALYTIPTLDQAATTYSGQQKRTALTDCTNLPDKNTNIKLLPNIVKEVDLLSNNLHILPTAAYDTIKREEQKKRTALTDCTNLPGKNTNIKSLPKIVKEVDLLSNNLHILPTAAYDTIKREEQKKRTALADCTNLPGKNTNSLPKIVKEVDLLSNNLHILPTAAYDTIKQVLNEVGGTFVPTTGSHTVECFHVAVSRWINNENNDFGYQLTDNTVGVVFNDGTCLVRMSPGSSNYLYVSTTRTLVRFTANSVPILLKKKVSALIRMEILLSTLNKTGVISRRRSTQLTLLIHWRVFEAGMVFLLSNGVMQVNFNDHFKMAINPTNRTLVVLSVWDYKVYQLSNLPRIEDWTKRLAMLNEMLGHLTE